MDIDPEARERLAAQMEARALDLGLTWRDIAERAGVSYEIVRRLRTSSTSIRPLTLRKIDAGFGWEAGSIERILNGGEPVATAGRSEEQLTPLDKFERAVAASPKLTDAEKAAAIRDHREQIRRQLAELGITEAPSFVRRAVGNAGRGDDADGRRDARPA